MTGSEFVNDIHRAQIKPGQLAQGYYDNQLTGVFDLRFEMYNTNCNLTKPPTPIVQLYKGLENELNIPMEAVPGKGLGSYSWQISVENQNKVYSAL